jgi:RNA-directed DNA polymerase
VDELKAPSKPFDISKQEVWEAYRQVKANQGAPGVDGCSIEDFEADLRGNLYKIWNRMASGSYFPPRSRRWSYQSRMAAGPGCSGCPPSRTGSPRRWWPAG